MAPVVLSIVNPVPELNVPPCVPVMITETFPSDEQIGGYLMLAEGVPLTDTVAVVVKTAHPPEAFIVYVIV